MDNKMVEIKLDEEVTKRIIIEALEEHHNKINLEEDPTIGRIFFTHEANEVIKDVGRYFLLYFLLSTATLIFKSSMSVDYGLGASVFSIKLIVYAFIKQFILIIISSILAIFSIKIYDKLVVKHTKFTRTFGIATILSAMSSTDVLDYIIVNFFSMF